MSKSYKIEYTRGTTRYNRVIRNVESAAEAKEKLKAEYRDAVITSCVERK